MAKPEISLLHPGQQLSPMGMENGDQRHWVETASEADGLAQAGRVGSIRRAKASGNSPARACPLHFHVPIS